MKHKHPDRKKEVKEELKELSPLLYQLKEKDPPFKVPEGYFNQLQNELLEQLRESPEQNSSKRSGWNIQKLLDQIGWLFQPRMGMAAASVLILLVAAWFLFQPNEGVPGHELNFASLSIEEIQNYINNNLDDFDEETVKKVAQDDQNIQWIPQNDIDTEELDRYLDEMLEEIDPRELEELL